MVVSEREKEWGGGGRSARTTIFHTILLLLPLSRLFLWRSPLHILFFARWQWDKLEKEGKGRRGEREISIMSCLFVCLFFHLLAAYSTSFHHFDEKFVRFYDKKKNYKQIVKNLQGISWNISHLILKAKAVKMFCANVFNYILLLLRLISLHDDFLLFFRSKQ